MCLYNKSIIMIQNKMHKNGQIVTINSHVYRITKEPGDILSGTCKYCDVFMTKNCLTCIRKPNLSCVHIIPATSILKRIDNIKSK